MMRFPPAKKIKKRFFSSRGFVLSFTVLTLSLFILIYAQMQTNHLFSIRLNESNLEQRTLPLRFALDARADLNALLDERVRVDQNAASVSTWVSATLPASIDLSASLLRYQQSLASLGRDANLSVFMDLNTPVSEGYITGRLTNELTWKREFANTTAIFRPSVNQLPLRYDINLTASLPYDSNTPWELDTKGDIYITLRYADQNTSHLSTSTGWIYFSDDPRSYVWTYGGGVYSLTLQVGLIDDKQGSLYIINDSPDSLSVSYTIRVIQDAPAGVPVRAGYDLPLSVVGQDGNMIASATQWVTN